MSFLRSSSSENEGSPYHQPSIQQCNETTFLSPSPTSTSHSTTTFACDLNANHPTWSRGTQNTAGTDLYNYLDTTPYTLLSPPYLATYFNYRTNYEASLDICFGSAHFKHELQFHTGPDIGSDHKPLIIKFTNFQPPTHPLTLPKWNIKYLDKKKWADVVHLPDTDEVDPNKRLSTITSAINSAATEMFRKTSGHRSNKPLKPWWNAECARTVTLRRRAIQKQRRQPSLQNWVNLPGATAAAKKTILSAKRASWATFCDSLTPTTPHSKVWATFNSIKGRPTFPLMINGSLCQMPQERANVLAECLKVTLSTPFLHAQELSLRQEIDRAIPLPMFGVDNMYTLSELRLALNRLPNGKAPGENSI
ncbi:uncharacterized protein [Procambarus clarkii]|uniref:uncharacterized protein n=1 Tax=Procambarus clarkii TaxID=6728 RepID=UPI00374322DB